MQGIVTKGLPRWSPEVVSVPVDTQESLCLPSQSTIHSALSNLLGARPLVQRGSRKLKDNGLRTNWRQTFLGLSPERAVGKGRL